MRACVSHHVNALHRLRPRVVFASSHRSRDLSKHGSSQRLRVGESLPESRVLYPQVQLRNVGDASVDGVAGGIVHVGSGLLSLPIQRVASLGPCLLALLEHWLEVLELLSHAVELCLRNIPVAGCQRVEIFKDIEEVGLRGRELGAGTLLQHEASQRGFQGCEVSTLGGLLLPFTFWIIWRMLGRVRVIIVIVSIIVGIREWLAAA